MHVQWVTALHGKHGCRWWAVASVCAQEQLEWVKCVMLRVMSGRTHAVTQAKLRARGVEVVEFDFLTPEAVADYCYSRGFLQVRD